MEELITWKQVPESEVPHDDDKNYWFVEDENGKGIFLKRIVTNILTDKEIFDLSNRVVPSFFDKDMWRKGYKVKQEELLK